MGKPDNSWCRKGGARGYIVTQDLHWWIGKKESGWSFVVEEGREFESSVPRFARWILSPDNPYFLKAAAIHDKLIEEGYRRPFCDSQWLEATRSVNAPVAMREVIHTLMRVRLMFRALLNMQR